MTRRLSDEERALWERVKGSATPLARARRALATPRPAPTAPTQVPGSPALPVASPIAGPQPLPSFRIGQAAERHRAHDLLPGLAESFARTPLRMDAGAYGKLKRGKLRPEARLDLHGMTLAEAHPELVRFVERSRAAGRRLVLVITGKGRLSDHDAPMPARVGRLRHDVPRWLSLPPLSGAVLQVAPAHPRHGGEGALYVYLRAL